MFSNTVRVVPDRLPEAGGEVRAGRGHGFER
jgi:hypothetical protein